MSKFKLPNNLPASFTVVSIFKSNYISAVAYEFEIENGQIVSCKPISEAPDVPVITLNHCTRKLGEALQKQGALK